MSSNDNAQWRYSKNNQIMGPASLSNIVDLYNLGDLDDSTQVWNGEDVDQWTPIKKVPAFAAKLSSQSFVYLSYSS